MMTGPSTDANTMHIHDMLFPINLQERAVLGICAALTALVLLTSIYGLMQWRNDWQLTHQKPLAAPSIATTDETTSLIAAIPKAHIFGKAIANVGGVPMTNLQLQVTGIVKIDGDKTNTPSKAYISISGQPSKIFQLGDSLPYGVKVYAITRDTVILENNGSLEKLLLSREPLQFKPRLSEE